MKLHELVRTKIRSKKRVGRGSGSGRGKTAGRGSKGQKAREKIPIGFSGLSLYKKLPLRRGFGNRKVSLKPHIIKLSQLNIFSKRQVIDLEKLIETKIITKKEAQRGVKVLGSSDLEKGLIVKLPVSKTARRKIEQKGGKVDYV